jgi:hypothetical protein
MEMSTRGSGNIKKPCSFLQAHHIPQLGLADNVRSCKRNDTTRHLTFLRREGSGGVSSQTFRAFVGCLRLYVTL